MCAAINLPVCLHGVHRSILPLSFLLSTAKLDRLCKEITWHILHSHMMIGAPVSKALFHYTEIEYSRKRYV
jgi:hypothetical protein